MWSIKQHFLRSSPKRDRDLGILAIDHTTEEFHQNKTISQSGTDPNPDSRIWVQGHDFVLNTLVKVFTCKELSSLYCLYLVLINWSDINLFILLKWIMRGNCQFSPKQFNKFSIPTFYDVLSSFESNIYFSFKDRKDAYQARLA